MLNSYPAWRWGQLNRRGAAEASEGRCLAVFVPGLYAARSRIWEYDDLLTQLDDALWRRFHERHWLPVRYLATYWSPANIDSIAGRVVTQMDDAVRQQTYDSIIVIAHSFGGLILRRAILLARERPWFPKLERVVLMASTSRGMVAATRVQRWLVLIGQRWQLHKLGLARLALAGLKPSPWLDDLSCEWRTWLAAQSHQTQVIQLQGTRDRVVQIHDDWDLATYPSFRELVLKDVGHRHFMLRDRWRQTADPKVLLALETTRRAVEDAVLS